MTDDSLALTPSLPDENPSGFAIRKTRGPLARGPSSNPEYSGNPEFRATDADREAFKSSYSQYDADEDAVRDIMATDDTLRGIPTEDLVAVRGYTGDEFYHGMNKALRSGDAEDIAKYDPHVRTVTSGLNQLPRYEGQVGRGIQINDPADLRAIIDHYVPGEVVQERAFVSTDTRVFPEMSSTRSTHRPAVMSAAYHDTLTRRLRFFSRLVRALRSSIAVPTRILVPGISN